ncbi:MAG: lysophospholipid acyltransferase family protein [Pyrinomonadaceae bacterium]
MKLLRSLFRFAAFFISTIGLYSIWWLGRLVVPNKEYWRETVFTLWAKSFVAVSNMKIEIVGQPPKPPFFLVSNHLSYVDVGALRAVVRGVFVAKREIEDWPLAGRLVRDMGNIFIDRQNRRDIPRAGELITERLKMGQGVIVFPEGTSTKGEEILPFNSSFLQFAAETDLPVSYVAISYLTPDGEMPASDAVCWWDDTTFLAHLLRLFSVREYTAVLNFGDEPVRVNDRKRLARELRQKVAERFVPVL